MQSSPTSRPIDPAGTPAVGELLREQSDRWDTGDRVAVEDLVRGSPALADDPPRLVPLIVNEWMLRWDAGEHPDLADYQARFPHVADELARQFRAQAAFERADPNSHRTKEYAPTADAPFTPTLGGYRLIGEVGSGGMGVVYRAEQLSLGRTVAVKFLLAGRAARDRQIDRFLNEGRLLARLDHPNVVRVVEIGTADHSPYIVMEYVDGRTLAQNSGGQPQPLAEAVRWVELLARAVAYCHEQGVLHRDLKPANVLLTADGVPKLTDFGLAKALDPDGPGQLTRTGDVMGTPSYMAPEQAAGRPADRTTDVYGLGAILYELLTGRPPFEGESTLGVMKQVLETPARSPRRLRPEVSRDLETVCLKCLEKQPTARYLTAAALADDLRRTQLGESISARPVGPIERGWRWCRRNRGVAVTTTAVFLILLTATVVSLGFANEANRQAGRAESNATAAQQQRDAAFEARWRGVLNEVVGLRHGQRPGQRADTLQKLAEVLALAREGGPLSAEDHLRFSAEATSAYGLTELVAAEAWEGWTDGTAALRFSPDLSRYARLSEKPIEIRSSSTGALKTRFTNLNAPNVIVPNGTDHFFMIQPDPQARGEEVLVRRGPAAEKRWPVVWKHSGVHDICVRTDGKLAAFNRDLPVGPLVVVDGETGAVLHEVTARTGLGRGAYHPTKPWLLTRLEDVKDDGLAIVDTSTGKVAAEVKVNFYAGLSVWHPDGRRFAVAGDDRLIRVFDDRLAEQFTLPFRCTSEGIEVAYSPTGEYLVTSDWSREVRVCDGTSGRLLLVQALPLADGLALAADNALTPERDGSTLRRHRLAGRAVRSLALAPLPDDPFGAVVWNPDRSLFLATHGQGGRACAVHDGHTGKVFAELPRQHVPLWFEADGRAIVTAIDREPAGGQTDLIYRWPVDHTARTVGPPERVVQQHRFGLPGASADRSVAAFAHVVYPKGLREPPVTLDLSRHRGHDIRATAVSPDGRWAVLCSHHLGGSSLYDLKTRTWQAELWVGPGRAVFGPDGATLAVFGEVSGRLFRTSDWAAVRELPGNEGAYSPDGKLLAVSGATRGVPVGTIELIEAATGRTVSRFEHPTRSRVDPVGFGPDPAKLYLRVRDTRTLDVWDLRDVRRRLKADFDLDWDWPEFPPAAGPPADPEPWVVKGVTNWNRWLPKVGGVDWNRVLPSVSPPVKR
jgi:WD40 repeat protein/predicted Ser/Thr protein kinase